MSCPHCQFLIAYPAQQRLLPGKCPRCCANPWIAPIPATSPQMRRDRTTSASPAIHPRAPSRCTQREPTMRHPPLRRRAMLDLATQPTLTPALAVAHPPRQAPASRPRSILAAKSSHCRRHRASRMPPPPQPSTPPPNVARARNGCWWPCCCAYCCADSGGRPRTACRRYPLAAAGDQFVRRIGLQRAALARTRRLHHAQPRCTSRRRRAWPAASTRQLPQRRALGAILAHPAIVTLSDADGRTTGTRAFCPPNT